MNDQASAPAEGIRDEVVALKRERIIAAAVELFYERGYEKTTLDAVAERLGVTKPFIYSYFSSKSELLAEICARGIKSSLKAMHSVLGTSSSPSEKLRLLGQRFVIAVLTSQKHIAIFSREEKNLLAEDFERISGLRREFDKKLTSLIEEGVRRGEFSVGDSRLAALAVGGMVSWAYVWYRPHGRFELAEVAERMSEMILALARARPRNRAAVRAGRRRRNSAT
jgi:AcrR family transcriptional regulator